MSTMIGPRPNHRGLPDRFGRVATDLRVSVTDRCNLRCTYCMPAEGMDWRPSSELLTAAEIQRLVRIGVQRLGIVELRLTGGEPLLQLDAALIAALHARGFRIAVESNGTIAAPPYPRRPAPGSCPPARRPA